MGTWIPGASYSTVFLECFLQQEVWVFKNFILTFDERSHTSFYKGNGGIGKCSKEAAYFSEDQETKNQIIISAVLFVLSATAALSIEI